MRLAAAIRVDGDRVIRVRRQIDANRWDEKPGLRTGCGRGGLFDNRSFAARIAERPFANVSMLLKALPRHGGAEGHSRVRLDFGIDRLLFIVDRGVVDFIALGIGSADGDGAALAVGGDDNSARGRNLAVFFIRQIHRARIHFLVRTRVR